MSNKLTARTVESLTRQGRHVAGRHTDADGLHLHVRPDGHAAWVLRFRIHGKQRDLGLGGYPAVGLAEARIKTREAKTLVSKGINPSLMRQQERLASREIAAAERSFRSVAEVLMESKGEAWRNAKHAAQWVSTLERYAFPVFGSWPVSEIGTDAVLAALKPIWTRTPETASRLRGRIEAILDFARARGWRSGDNPARWRGHLSELLPAPRKIAPVTNQPSLPWIQVPIFYRSLVKHRGVTSQALAFLILTAARSGEVRGMTWSEIDLNTQTWSVPAGRMKAARLHRVPLSPAATAVLEAAGPDLCARQGLVFEGATRNRPLSDMALGMLVKGMATDGLEIHHPARWRDIDGRPVVPHGFRSSFRGWTRAHGWQDHLGEIALAHADKDRVRAAYARDDLLEERRPMMDAWARWCLDGQP